MAFFAECVQIPDQNSTRGRSPLELFDYQEDDLALLRGERFVAVLKARQLGLTTLMMAYALWLLLFRPGTNIILVSKDQPTANKALGEMLDFMWDFLPPWAKARAPELEVDQATEHVWVFPDGMRSRIISRAATDTAGAGETATLVIWDEAALAKMQEDTLRTLMPTTDAGGSFVLFSTARGAHNRFARVCREAQAGTSQFELVFHPWFLSRLINPKAHLVRGCTECGGKGFSGGDDDRVWCERCVDATIYEAKRRDFADEPHLFYAEYPTTIDEAFRMSGRSRFPTLAPIEEYENFPLRGRLEWDGRGGIEFVEDERGPLRLREDALDVPSWAKSVLAVDPATGVGGDYTAMTGGWLDRDGIPQRVAFWHANDIEPIEAARQADMLGRFLSGDEPALLVVEKAGGYGDTFIHELRSNLNYPRMYRHRLVGHRKRKLEHTFGFPMNQARRPLVIDRLAQWLVFDGERLVIDGVDPLLRHELGAFVVKDNGKVEADVGMHDDLVMSCGIWLYVLTEEVGAATDDGMGEKAPAGALQTFSLESIWREAEEARRLAERTHRRETRRLTRRGR